MVLDKSKVSIKIHGLEFNFVEHVKNNPPKVVKLVEERFLIIEWSLVKLLIIALLPLNNFL